MGRRARLLDFRNRRRRRLPRSSLVRRAFCWKRHMKLQELHANEELRHHEFPVTREKIYLAHAAVCPLPRRVSEAISNYATGSSSIQQESVLPPGWLTETRQVAAKFLGVALEEVAFVGPTSNALSM